MKIALDEFNNRIYSRDGVDYKNADITCPCCKSKVIFCNGKIIRPYFRHEAKESCFSEWEPETYWHYDMKNMFNEDEIEIIVSRGENYKKADVQLKNGLVIEMQHSPISYDELRIRESFYQNMVWIFDATEPYSEGRISVYKNDTVEWIRPRMTLKYSRHYVFINLCENYFIRLANISIGYEYKETWHSYRTPILRADAECFDEFELVKLLRNIDNNIQVQEAHHERTVRKVNHSQLILF